MEEQNRTPVKKIQRIGICELAACLIIVFATALRVIILSTGWPQTDSDEGTMGLVAFDIAYRGAHPLFLYGQDYMGTIQAYLGAIFFHLFGPSLFSLRLGTTLLFALFLLSMYLLTSLLYTKKLALITLVILSVGSSEVIFRELAATGGYAEVSLFSALLLFLSTRLALSAPSGSSSNKPSSQRLLTYASWGLLAGLAFWSHPLSLPFIAAAALVLLVFCRREMRVQIISVLLLGVLIGVTPLIIAKLTTPPNQVSLYLVGSNSSNIAATNTGPIQHPLGLQVAGAVAVSLPIATGGNTLCPLSRDEAWPLSSQSSAHTIQCTLVHAGWGLGFILLWAVAAFLAIKLYWRRWLFFWKKPPTLNQSAAERRNTILHFARLMLLCSVGSILLLYSLFPQPAMTPWPSARYLSGLLLGIPALLSPLWGAIHATRRAVAKVIILSLRYAALALIGIAFLLGPIELFEQIPTVQAQNQQQNALIQHLVEIGATHIYSEYWTCDRLTFLSEEHIVCSVLDEQLRPGLDRYLSFRTIVTHDPKASYVFPTGSAQALAFASHAAHSQQHYHYFTFDGYVIYQPDSTTIENTQ